MLGKFWSKSINSFEDELSIQSSEINFNEVQVLKSKY